MNDKQGKLFGRAVKIKEPKEPKQKKESDLKLNSLSYTAIRDYLSCPKLFYYRHYLKLKLPQKQMELVFGSAVHAGFEAFAKFQDPLIAFNQEFDSKKLLPEELEGTNFADHVEEGKRFVQVFLDNQKYLNDVYGIRFEGGEAERKFRTWMLDPITKQRLPVAFSGRVDFETADGRIIDYKTSSKLYKQPEVDQDLQPSYYILEYLLRKGELPEGFYYIVFVKGRKEPLQVMRTTRTKEQLSLAYKMADLVVKGVNGNQFDRTNDFRHSKGWCDCVKYESSLLL